MIIRYCPKCYGNPYTTDSNLKKCPTCGTKLELDYVDDDDLRSRSTFSASAPSPTVQPGPESIPANYSPSYMEPSLAYPSAYPTRPAPSLFTSGSKSTRNRSVVVGRVYDYRRSDSQTDGYSRSFLQKIVQAIAFGQSMDDTLQRFAIHRTEDDGSGYSINNDVIVNYHGRILGGAGICDNSKVRVSGKYYRGTLMANRVEVFYGDTLTPVNVNKPILPLVLFIAAVIAIIAIVFSGGGTGASLNMSQLGQFLSSVVTLFFILLVLVWILFPGGLRHKRISIPGILILSIAITIYSRNRYGSLNAFGSHLFSQALGIAIPILVVVAIIRLFTKKR